MPERLQKKVFSGEGQLEMFTSMIYILVPLLSFPTAMETGNR